MRNYPVVLLLSLGVVASLGAQVPAPPSPTPSIQPREDSSYVIERLRTRVRFENDGTGTRAMSVAVKVLDEQAVRQWGQIVLAYQSETEELAVRRIQVQKPDGSVVPTADGRIQDLAVQPPGAASPTFLDLRQKVITVSALRPGDVVNVDAEWTTKKPIAAGHFWYEHSFESTATVRDEQLELDLPAQRTVSLKTAPGAPPEETGGSGTVSAGRRIYRWKRSHVLEPGKVTKPLPRGDEEPAADVRLSSFRNWNEFTGWFGGLTSTAPDAAVKAKAVALTAGAADDAGKIAAIYRYVSTEIRYVSLSFGVGRLAAHPPAEVLANQYGDCKDKTVLLQALLAAVGIRSVPVLLNSERSIADDFASPLEFDHMVALIQHATDPSAGTWMDATLEVAPLGMLAAPTRDKRALRIEGRDRGVVVRTPADPPFASVDEVRLDGAVNAIGVLVAKVTYAVRGDSELVLRGLLRAAPRSSLKDLAAGLAAQNGLEGEISDVSTTDPSDTSAPFQLTFQLRKRGYFNWAARPSTMSGLLKLQFPFAKDDERSELERIHLGSPMTVRLRTTIVVPDGYVIDPPQTVNAAKAGLTYESKYVVEQRRLLIDREVRFDVRQVPSSSFSDYSALAATAAADFAQPIKVRGDVTGTPQIPADATADEMYGAAFAAYEAARYDAAVALWKRNTEIAPKMGSAWVSLGLAYNQLRKYDEAAAAIQKQIDLDPNDERAYGDLGLVLKGAGNRDAAATAYAKHVLLNPLDAAALKELGYLQIDLRRFPDAIVTLEKAAGLVKNDGWLFAQLGSAYLQSNEREKSRLAFDRALELSPTVATWTKIAWQLAEAGVELERAEELAIRAEKQISEETRRLDLASVNSRHLDLMQRLAWIWDTIGWIRFQAGNLPEAERYVRASWQLGGYSSTALHLGQIYEKRDRLADALSFYLTAQALASSPSPEMLARVKRLSGGGDVTAMLRSARETAAADRRFPLSEKGTGRAEFLVIIDGGRRALESRFSQGADALKPLAESALRGVQFPLEFPTTTPLRLALGIRVSCDAQASCRGLVEYPSRVELAK